MSAIKKDDSPAEIIYLFKDWKKPETKTIFLPAPKYPLVLEVGFSIACILCNNNGGRRFLERINFLRKLIKNKDGAIMPSVNIRDNRDLKDREYRLLLNGVEIIKGKINPSHYLIFDAKDKKDTWLLRGADTSYGPSAFWIKDYLNRETRNAGYKTIGWEDAIFHKLHLTLKENLEKFKSEEIKKVNGL